MDRSQVLACSAVAVIVTLIVIIICITRCADNHFKQFMNGFWIHDDIDSKCILFIDTDTNTMKVISILSETKTVNDKLDIKFASQTWYDMYMRKYKFIGSGSKISGKHAKILTRSDLQFDLYATEGTMILSDANGDLMTFLKDNSMNLELVL